MSQITATLDLNTRHATELTAGLPVTFEALPDPDEFRFTGAVADLETLVWRYVTPLELSKSGIWLTADTADEFHRYDFDHFFGLN